MMDKEHRINKKQFIPIMICTFISAVFLGLALYMCSHGIFLISEMESRIKNIGLFFYLIAAVLTFRQINGHADRVTKLKMAAIWIFPFLSIVILLVINSFYRYILWNSFFKWETPFTPYRHFLFENLLLNRWRYVWITLLMYLTCWAASTLLKTVSIGNYVSLFAEKFLQGVINMNYIHTEVMDCKTGITIQKDSVSAWLNRNNELQLNGAYTINDLESAKNKTFVIKCMLVDDTNRVLYSRETIKLHCENSFDTFRIIEANLDHFVNIEDIDKVVFFTAYE